MNPGNNEKKGRVADRLADGASPGKGQDTTERRHADERLREYENVVENLEDMTVDELVAEFGVTREQIHAVLQFAAHSSEANTSAPRP